VIRSTDTVDINTAINFTGSNSNNLCSLTVDGAIKLGAQVNMNVYSAFVANAGASIDLNGYDISGMAGGSFRKILIDGNSLYKVKIFNSTGSGRIYYDDRNGNGSETTAKIYHCDFRNMGDINLLPWNTTDSLIIDHCTFSSCKRLYVGRWYAAATIHILNSDFINSRDESSGNCLDIGSGENIIAPDIVISHCSFRHNSGGAVVFTNQRGLLVKDNVFRNVNMSFLSPDFLFTKNSMFQSDCWDDSKLFGDVAKGKIVNNYFWSDRDNPHWFSGLSGVVDSNIIENTYGQGFGDAGDFIVSHEDDTLWVRHNIFVDGANGSYYNQVGGSSGGVTYIYNNTYFANMSRPVTPPFYGAIRNESGGVFSGTVSVFNNIFCNRSGAPQNAAVNLETAGIDQIDSTDFNSFYNVADHYYQVTITGRTEGQQWFGASDITGYPQFADTTRCITDWKPNGIDTLLKINGYDPVNYTQHTATNKIPDSLISYVRSGFVPANTTLSGAGKNGVDIGAVAVSSEPDYGIHLNSGHPRLFMKPDQVSGFRTACKTGYNSTNYAALKSYVDACLSGGWGSGWGLMNLQCATVVALVENTSTYLNAAHSQAQSFLSSLNPNDIGQFAGLTLSALAMYYDLLWDNNSSMRQAVADKLHACWAVEGTGSEDSHYGNHYLDAIERSTWFALACKGDGYYDADAITAYQTFLNRWYYDGDLKSIIRQVSGDSGCVYEGSYYFVQNWLPVLSVMLAAFETSHDDLPANFVKENYSMIYNASKILMHAKRPWDRMLDQTGDTYATWHIIGWVGKAIAQKWGGQMGQSLMALLGNTYDSDASLGDPATNSWRNGPRGMMVLYNQNLNAIDYDTIATSYKATGEGGITSYMRSSWNDQNATWATFQAQDDMGGHVGAIQGHFQIGKYAPLATKSGSYCVFEDNHHYQYSFRTYAHNCATIYRADEVFPNSYTLQNDGGQNFAGTFWETNYSTSLPDLSNGIQYKSGPDYTYSSADITNAYSLNTQKKVSKYRRSFVYFKPDYFLVIDKIDALSGSYEKKWLLHTPNQPTISGLSARADNGSGRLFYKTLLPNNATMTSIGGATPGYYYNVYNSTNYPPDCERYESQTWRTEVSAPLGKENDIFLNALQAASTSQGTMVTVDTLVTISTGFKGAHFKTSSNPRIAVFSTTNNRGTRVSFTPSQTGWSGTAGILITDLDTGTYKIYKNNVMLTAYSSVNVDSSGVLYFTDNSFGDYEVLLTSEDPTAPPPPVVSTLYNQTVKNGSIATFTAIASGPGTITYQWQKNNVDISGATNATYFFTASKADHGATYRCIATNAGGSDTTNAAVLSVSNVWPTGTQRAIKFTVNKNRVAETLTNFLYQGKAILTNDAAFKACFNSAANLTIFDTTTGLQRPARIWYYTKDTVWFDFDWSTSISVNKEMFLCAGLTINRANSAQAYTNSGISNFWGFDEQTGSAVVADYAGGNVGTLNGSATIIEGVFGNQINLSSTTTSSVIAQSLPTWISRTSHFTYNMLLTLGADNTTNRILFVFYKNNIERVYAFIFNNMLYFAIGSEAGLSYGGCSISGLTGRHHYTFVYDGNQTTNQTRAKIYIDGVVQNIPAYQNTVPSLTPDLTGGYYGIIGAASASYFGTYDNVKLSNSVLTDGIIQTSSNQLMQSDFWTQSTSVSVGGINRRDRSIHRGVSTSR
jgi:hypothetical protein